MFFIEMYFKLFTLFFFYSSNFLIVCLIFQTFEYSMMRQREWGTSYSVFWNWQWPVKRWRKCNSTTQIFNTRISGVLKSLTSMKRRTSEWNSWEPSAAGPSSRWFAPTSFLPVSSFSFWPKRIAAKRLIHLKEMKLKCLQSFNPKSPNLKKKLSEKEMKHASKLKPKKNALNNLNYN